MKKLIKGKQLAITESLTANKVAEKGREEHGAKSVWSVNGRIMFKVEGTKNNQ